MICLKNILMWNNSTSNAVQKRFKESTQEKLKNFCLTSCFIDREDYAKEILKMLLELLKVDAITIRLELKCEEEI